VNKVGLALLLGVIVCAAAALRVRGARMFPVIGAAAGVVLLVSPSFFLHYAALSAPWVVLTVAVGVSRLLRALRSRRARAVIAMALLAALVTLNLREVELSRPSAPIPVSALRPAAQQVAGCVVSDDPQILAALDVLSRDLSRHCMVWPDVTGYTYDRDSVRVAGHVIVRQQNAAWQADVTHYLLSGEAVIVHRSATELDASSTRSVDSGRVLARSGSWTLHAVSH
jgi:hypothetical protein